MWKNETLHSWAGSQSTRRRIFVTAFDKTLHLSLPILPLVSLSLGARFFRSGTHRSGENRSHYSDHTLAALVHDGEWYTFRLVFANDRTPSALRTPSLTGEPPRPTIPDQWSLHPNSSARSSRTIALSRSWVVAGWVLSIRPRTSSSVGLSHSSSCPKM
jgi:hypothetical protein